MNTQERYALIRELYKEFTYREIAKKLDISIATVGKAIRGKNAKPRELQVYDRDFFEVIDSESKAYILGFLFADGNVSLDKSMVRIRLAERDGEILMKIAKELKITKPLSLKNYHGYPSLELAFYGKKTCEDLIRLGCVCSKSDKIVFPNLRNDLIPHFIRGYFDGDGCIGMYLKKKRAYVTICSTPSFNETLLQFLRDNSEIVGGIYNHKNIINYSEIHICGTKSALMFFDLIYKDATIFLQRKFDKFQEVIEIAKTKRPYVKSGLFAKAPRLQLV
jgi:intein-encoded DNA endonuclease-like protein